MLKIKALTVAVTQSRPESVLQNNTKHKMPMNPLTELEGNQQKLQHIKFVFLLKTYQIEQYIRFTYKKYNKTWIIETDKESALDCDNLGSSVRQ